MKEYIALHSPRSIGVGYAAADVDTMLTDTWNYLDCYLSNSTYSQIDFFGLNNYEWCGASTYTESGYDDIIADFAGNNIPVFFSEYGCNDVQPRTFTNVQSLYGDNMTELSGGLAYEYSEESSDYGMDEFTLNQSYHKILTFTQVSSLSTAQQKSLSWKISIFCLRNSSRLI